MGLLRPLKKMLRLKSESHDDATIALDGAEGAALVHNVRRWASGERDISSFGPGYYLAEGGVLGVRLSSNPFDE